MSKIHEYIILTKKLRAARREMLAAQEKITFNYKNYSIDHPEIAQELGCVNKFEKVVSETLNIFDDGGYTKNCHLFTELPCANRKCPWFAKNLDYTVAKERYDAARNARRAFLRGLRGARTK